MNNNLINTILYTIGWTLALTFASIKLPLYAALGSFTALAAQVSLNYSQKFKYFFVEFYLVIYALLIGLIAETIFINLNVVDYFQNSHFPPLWVLCLYMLFATTFNLSFEVMKTNPAIPIIVALFAPLAYFGASLLGVCAFPLGFWITALVLLIGWQIIVYLLITLNQRLLKINDEIDQISTSPTKTTLLYDGKCPLCSREVSLLNSSEGKNKLKMIDISSKDYDPSLYQNLSYDEAMKKMHTFDENQQLESGVDAFFKIYSKANWKGFAMGLKAPLFSQIGDFLYPIFAKYRLKLTGR